jgi:hypothetical protein
MVGEFLLVRVTGFTVTSVARQRTELVPRYKQVCAVYLHMWAFNKVRELIAVKVLHTSLLITTVDAFKETPWEAMHRCQHPFHLSKQFWNWFCGMAFRAAVVLLLMSSMSSKCIPLNISFISGNRKKSLGARSGEYAGYSNIIICLVAKNSLTHSVV